MNTKRTTKRPTVNNTFEISDGHIASKRKKVLLIPSDELVDTDSQSLTTDSPVATDSDQIPIFKDQTYARNKMESGKKRARIWKNLKQIVAAERLASQSDPHAVTYSSADAPPSLKPAKKYSDITGIEALYVDPQTKLRYANADEYSRVRLLPSDIVSGLLSLRKALPQVQ